MVTADRPESRFGGAQGASKNNSSKTSYAYQEASRYIPGGTSRIHYHYQPYPIFASSGSGCYLTDVEGTTRLDFLNNMTSLIHGHANPAITEALVEQIRRGTAFSEPSEPEAHLAKLMAERVRSIERIRFSNSGTEAVMMAIKLARACTGRSRIAKFEGFYHGYYDYVQVSYSSTAANWGPPDAPASTASSGGLASSVLDDVLVMPYNNREAVERLMSQYGASLAALITDPLSNRAGFPQPTDGFLEFLRQITSQYGVVLIFDEVISFRVAYSGAQGKYGGKPDLTTFGKIMGGGMPIGAVGGRLDIMALLDPTKGAPVVASGGTFSANPLSMVAGLAAMKQMNPEAYARLDALGDRLRTGANALLRAAELPWQITGDGSLFKLVLSDVPILDYRSSMKRADTAGLLARFHLRLLDEGIIISKEGLGCLSTPMGDEHVDEFLAGFERALRRMSC